MMLKFTLLYNGDRQGECYIETSAITFVAPRNWPVGSFVGEDGKERPAKYYDFLETEIGGRWLQLDAENGEALKRILAVKATSVNISLTDEEAEKMRQFYGLSEANRGR